MRKALLCLLTLSATTLQAQQILTFDEALQKSTSQNQSIKAIEYEEQAARHEMKAARGLRMPQLEASGTYAYLQKDIGFDLNGAKQPISGALGDIAGVLPPDLGAALGGAMGQLMAKDWNIVLQERSLGFAGLSATMPLYTGGKINAANNAAKIRMEETAQTGNQTKNALVSQLVERYFGLALAKQVVEVRKQVLEGMEKHLYDAKALEANGMIARGELLYAEMHVAQARKELMKATRDAEVINSALCNTMNDEGSYTPVTTMFIVNNIEPLAHFQTLAEDKNPLLKKVSLTGDLAREGVRLEKSEFFPQVALMGGYSFYNYQVSHIIPSWAVGAGIKIKLFDGLSREHKFAAAKEKVRQVESVQGKAQADIATMVEKLYNEMATSADQITADDASLRFAEEYLRIKDKAFVEGTASSSDVVDARLNLAKIRTERLQAAFRYDLLLANLLEVCGQSEIYNSYITEKNITPITVK